MAKIQWTEAEPIKSGDYWFKGTLGPGTTWEEEIDEFVKVEISQTRRSGQVGGTWFPLFYFSGVWDSAPANRADSRAEPETKNDFITNDQLAQMKKYLEEVDHVWGSGIDVMLWRISANLVAEVERLQKTLGEQFQREDLVYVPGEWLCPKCQFRQHQRILWAKDLTATISTESPDESCPNCKIELVRLTYKQDATEANRVGLALMKQIGRFEDQLSQARPYFDSYALQNVANERERQDKKWGGPDHDDTHSTSKFAEWINERAVTVMKRSETHIDRKNLIEIAALAVAAVESMDRWKRENESK